MARLKDVFDKKTTMSCVYKVFVAKSRQMLYDETHVYIKKYWVKKTILNL